MAGDPLDQLRARKWDAAWESIDPGTDSFVAAKSGLRVLIHYLIRPQDQALTAESMLLAACATADGLPTERERALEEALRAAASDFGDIAMNPEVVGGGQVRSIANLAIGRIAAALKEGPDEAAYERSLASAKARIREQEADLDAEMHRVMDLEAERDAAGQVRDAALAKISDLTDERDALRGAVERVEELARRWSARAPISAFAGGQKAAMEHVRALLAAARIEAG